MSQSIDIDKAGECLRNILDNNRCGICDKLGKTYWRCVHGHIACDDCSVKAEECPTCFTTFNSPVVNNAWVRDESQSEKVKHALDLLNTFQDTFKTDVYKRQRISDQLKAEKEVFPNCIQAPAKYSNKRKSVISSTNKENRSELYYPGQEISTRRTSKMEKSKFVQQWLQSSTEKPSRKPFANINVNNQRFSGQNQPYHKSRAAKNNCINKLKKSPIKRPSKTFKNENKCITRSLKKSSLSSLPKTSKERNTENLITMKDHPQIENTKRIQDDSGIAMDEECITIEDSQTEIIDKDELALQAVYEAERNELDDSMAVDVDSHCISKKQDFIRVPFQKKSLLYVSSPDHFAHPYYNNCNIDAQNDSMQDQYTNNLCITVEYGSKVEPNKQSVSVQTEISGIDKTSDLVTNDCEKLISPKIGTIYDESLDIFMDNINVFNTHVQNKENVIIDDSDTDVEAEHLQVAAEVHRACQLKDYTILSELALNEMENRKRRAQRGVTPGSTDSSEKENFDPNRMKRGKFVKKGKKKLIKDD